MFLLNSRYRHFSATLFSFTCKSLHLMRAHLLPKLRCQFAEFLNESSLTRLRIFSSPTCVGFGTVTCYLKLRGFSWKHGINDFVSIRSRHHVSALTGKRICLPLPAYTLKPGHPIIGSLTFLRPPIATTGGTGILTCFPSPTPFGLGLGTD